MRPKPSADAVSATRVYLGKDALIDVSGLDATAPMSRNQLAIQLYSEQLKDTPLLRGTDFLGKTVYVDIRKGTDLIAADALAAAKAIKGITIAEVMSRGGTVKLEASLGDTVLANGSKIDVSGGSITYDAGFVRESQLLYKGSSIAISQANKNTPYDGFSDNYSVTSQKWGVTRSWNIGNINGQYYQAYINGSDAGSLSLSAKNALLQADLKGFATNGFYQRDGQVMGASFTFFANTDTGIPSLRLVSESDSLLANNFSVVGAFDDVATKFTQGSVLSSDPIQLKTSLFETDRTKSAGGFTRFSLNQANVSVEAPIYIAPTTTSKFELKTMGQANVNANIIAPGGVITISAGNTSLSNNVKISTSGLYTNDTAGIFGAMLGNVMVNAGNITIQENDSDKGGLSLGAGVKIEANAGAWLNSSNQLTGGKGGSVSLAGVAALGDAMASAYGFSQGGSLSISAYRNIQAGGQLPVTSSLLNTLFLPEAFFGQGGFNQYTIKTTYFGSGIMIGDAAGSVTNIHPQAEMLMTNAGFRTLVSGTDMSIVTKPIMPPDYLLKPVSTTFNSTAGLTLANHAMVILDAPTAGAGGNIVLQANEQMNILGSLIAPAGTVSADLVSTINQYPNYDASLSIFVGPNALLSAKGSYAISPSQNGLIKAVVSDAGSISLNGHDRAVIILKQGSMLDVSGVSGEVDVPLQSGYARKTLNGSAGTINITSRNGMVIDGDMKASASASGKGGALNLTFAGGDDSTNVYPNGSRTILLTSNKMLQGASLNVGDSLNNVTGSSQISSQQIVDAGFVNLSLDVDRSIPGDKILLENGLDLKLQNALTMKASLLEVANNGTAKLDAGYIAIGGVSKETPVLGGADLQLNAKWIDLIGDVALSGVNKTSINATLDIRGRGLKADITNEGSLSTNGVLTLTARQIYPVTNGAFRFETYGTGNSIEIKSSGVTATDVPLSAAGLLTLKADKIIQGGTLQAPLGQIVLEAANELSFSPGSLTSVSAGGQLIPYGLTRLGGLDMLAPTSDLVASANGDGLKNISAKQVSIKASIVEMNAGATINVSGGNGDTLAYEWIQGIGGSSDILAKVGTFAVLPSLKKGEYAPFDYNYTQSNVGINAGDSIHLAGVRGLADGDYVLLPARYALLPGAFMVQTSNNAITQASTVAQVDGSSLVSSYKMNGGFTDTNYSAFKVMSGSIFYTQKGEVSKAPSEYRLSYGNAFFTKLAQDSSTSTPRLSSDAGQLVINATNNLILDSTVLANKPEGARGALVDINSGSIRVVSTIDPNLNGFLQLTASSLNRLNVDSLLLGGTRAIKPDGSTQVTPGATSLVFANDQQNTLLVKELIATSTGALTVSPGASISSVTASGTIGSSKLKTAGEGALLALSSFNDFEFERTGAIATGDLNVAATSNIFATRSMVLDSRANASLNGNLSVADAGTLSLGAGHLILGEGGSATDLKVSTSWLTGLSKVTLNSYKNIDIYGAVDLGNQALDLTFNTGAIAGHMGNNQIAKLSANNFMLKNSLGAAYESVSSISGSKLELSANNIQFAGGIANTNTMIAGFETVQLNASKEITFAGVGITNINAATIALKSSRISAASASDFTIASTGAMTTAFPDKQTDLAAVNGLGAKLTMTATDLTLGGKVELPSGNLIAKATSGNLTVTSTGQLKATSAPVFFNKNTEYTPAGSVTLQADGGNVVVDAGGLVDVSGKQASGDFGGDAGTINIVATKGSTINGNIKGLASAGYLAGSFVLDTKTLSNFSDLNTALNAGGFTNLIDMRIRSGNITIAAGDRVNAQHVVLTADGSEVGTGNIDVFGTVDASGSNGGNIEIYARDNLTLKTGSTLLAKGTGQALVAGDSFVGAGGRVLLSSLSQVSTSAISAENGALIDVSGDQQGAIVGEKGSVTMRAYRGTTGITNTVNVATNATAAVTGANTVRLEGVKVYTSTTFNTATPSIVSETNNFYTANLDAGIYSTKDGTNVIILPNIEVRSSATLALNDLTVATDLNMRNFGALLPGKGGTLTLRSNNNLKVNGTLSDGFNGFATGSVLQSGDSFTYNLVAGADLSSANQMATIKSANALQSNFNLANGKIIRTGTGEINIAAGGNLTMGDASSVIYTVGKAADAFAGFTPPPTTATSASYLTQGGDININVQGDINGKIASTADQQLVTNWLFRQGGGTSNKNVSWWVRPDLFKQGVAAFGGGDVTVNAGGSITNFSVSVPTNARYDSQGLVSLNGGGDLFVKAGGDVKSGIYFAGKGNVNLLAGGTITSAADINGNPNNLGTTLALQDASAKVYAIKGAAIETVFNPTMWAQSNVNSGTSGFSLNGDVSFFLTYGQNSQVNVSSLSGDVLLGRGSVSLPTTALTNVTPATSALEVYPSSLSAISYNGNIRVNRLVLSPSSSGNLSLLASADIKTTSSGLIAMSGADISLLPRIFNPLNNASSSTNGLANALLQLRNANAATPIHASDSEPILIVAQHGNVDMQGDTGTSNSKGAGLSSPKAVNIYAGNDLKLNAKIQHDNSNDISLIQATRDVVMQSNTSAQINLGGPGDLLVEAGRNISLGVSGGIVTVANTLNPALSSQGASITVIAGLGSLGASVADYVHSYINPNGQGPSTLQGDTSLLASYRSDTAKQVASYMRQMTGNSALSEDAAMAQYLSLDLDRQTIFAYRHFSSELLADGKAYAVSQNHLRGDSAIATLFPSDRSYKGDLSLYNSQIRTSRDGNVDILTPGGFINAGVPTSSGNNIGIVTEQGGAIRAFAETGFQVEQSKIITQYGSDITVWVNNGDIDAGRGSKTALSVPQRIVSTNADGQTTVEAKGAAAGSGIRAQTYDSDGPVRVYSNGTVGLQTAPALGSVALMAPRGILNASEAGIAAGNFLAVATQVLGANNITVSGTSSGVPLASTGSVAGAMTGVSNAAADATKSIASDVTRQATNNTSVKTPMPSLISVEVIGLGD